MPEQTAICPSCDNIIELDGEVFVGEVVSCSNMPCMWEGIVEYIEKEGNVWFEPDEGE